jgi:ATP-dependent Clp protease ATP-binding subunit ClpB
MASFVKRVSEKKIALTLTAAAKALLFREGYDPAYGARPMKRAIQRLIQDPLALKILGGAVQPGDTIVVDADTKTGEMKFEPGHARAGAA